VYQVTTNDQQDKLFEGDEEIMDEEDNSESSNN
jgi:hypothetical protein